MDRRYLSELFGVLGIERQETHATLENGLAKAPRPPVPDMITVRPPVTNR